MSVRRGQASEQLTTRDVAVIKSLLIEGYQHKRIAALMDCNQGRISEINTGSKKQSVKPAWHDEEKFYPLYQKDKTMNILKTVEYNGFLIHKCKPAKKTTWRVYKGEKYLQTCGSQKTAKGTIDFNIGNGNWK